MFRLQQCCAVVAQPGRIALDLFSASQQVDQESTGIGK
jgi:hypothetical protein